MNKRIPLFILFFFLSSVHLPKACALETYPFKGSINFREKVLQLAVGQDPNTIELQLALPTEKDVQLNLMLEHLKTSFFEISTQLKSSIHLTGRNQSKSPILYGQFYSQYSLLNHKPTDELIGNFEIRNQTLEISDLIFGGLQASGSIELSYPYKLNLMVNLREISIYEFLAFWLDDPNVKADGFVSGKIQLSGNLTQPILKGSISTWEGFVEELAYDALTAEAEGPYPVVKLNGSVTQKDGLSFNFEGPFDLSKRGEYRKELTKLSRMPVVVAGNSQTEWTIKKKEKEEDPHSEFKYFLRKKGSSDNALKEESEVLGVEQKIKF